MAVSKGTLFGDMICEYCLTNLSHVSKHDRKAPSSPKGRTSVSDLVNTIRDNREAGT